MSTLVIQFFLLLKSKILLYFHQQRMNFTGTDLIGRNHSNKHFIAAAFTVFYFLSGHFGIVRNFFNFGYWHPSELFWLVRLIFSVIVFFFFDCFFVFIVIFFCFCFFCLNYFVLTLHLINYPCVSHSSFFVHSNNYKLPLFFCKYAPNVHSYNS